MTARCQRAEEETQKKGDECIKTFKSLLTEVSGLSEWVDEQEVTMTSIASLASSLTDRYEAYLKLEEQHTIETISFNWKSYQEELRSMIEAFSDSSLTDVEYSNLATLAGQYKRDLLLLNVQEKIFRETELSLMIRWKIKFVRF